MRFVLDTNVVVAGLLWNGPPRRLLDMAIDEAVYLCTSGVLIDELKETLSYAKFAQRIARFGTSVPILVARYEALVTEVSVPATPRVVVNDPDDDHVLACAMAARADMIVSGDRHLLDLASFEGIAIVTPAVAERRASRPRKHLASLFVSSARVL